MSDLSDRLVNNEAGGGVARTRLGTMLIQAIKDDLVTLDEAVAIARAVRYGCDTARDERDATLAIGTFFMEAGRDTLRPDTRD